MKTITTTKVQSTQEVNTSYGLKHCCKGKLVLIPTDKPLGVGLLAQSKSIPEKFTILNYATVEDFKDDIFEGWQIIDPIIISETESIEQGDKRYIYTDVIAGVNKNEALLLKKDKGSWRKILAMPENISPKQLQAIVDGKLNDGDEVLVGCIKVTEHEHKHTGTYIHISYHVEHDLKDYITLHKAHDETWDAIFNRMNMENYTSKDDVFGYLKKHYISPKRIN